jgi:hypothetical protein
MAQLNVYVPDELEEKIKLIARRENKSVSSFLADLVRERFAPKEWKKEFLSVLGKWEGDFPEIKRLRSQERDDL